MAHTSSLPKPNPWSVRAVLADLPRRPQENSSSPVPFFHYLERLKLEKREGWRRFGLGNGESIADHMYRMSLITMLAPPALASRLDLARCTRMALVHDMAEGLVGDLTPVDGVPKAEKNRREASTMDWVAESLLGKVHGGQAGRDIRAVWQEYEDSETIESRFVHDVDKIELVLQMVEYEAASDCSLDLSEFTGVIKRLSLPEMKEWAQEILKERHELWETHGKQPQRPHGPAAEKIEGQQNEYYGNGHVNVDGTRIELPSAMGAGAYLEPLTVVILLFGGAWINRTQSRRSSSALRTRLSSAESSDEDEGEAEINDGLLITRSPRSLSPSLLPSQDSRWRDRELRFFRYSASVKTPNTAVFRNRFLSRVLSKLPFLVEAWYWALIYWVYQLGRAFTALRVVEGAVHLSRKHALQVIQAEKSMHIFWELRIQRFFLAFPRLMTTINWLYSFIHIPGTIAFLVWLFYYTITSTRPRQTRIEGNMAQAQAASRSGEELYKARRRTMAMCNLLAFVVFTLWPCMPPRLLSDPAQTGPLAEVAKSYDFVDTVHGEGGAKSVWTENRFCNQYAAMPSLHFGYALLIGVTIMTIPLATKHQHSKSVPLPFSNKSQPELGPRMRLPSMRRLACVVAGVLYPLTILVAIISTANHFILDAVAGALVCLIGWKSNTLLLNLLPLEDHFLWWLRIHKPEQEAESKRGPAVSPETADSAAPVAADAGAAAATDAGGELSGNAAEGDTGDAVAAASSDAPNGEAASAAPATTEAEAEADAAADIPTDEAAAKEDAPATGDADTANGASGAKKNGNSKRKSAGAPEHKSKKANKRKSTTGKITHIDAQPGELYFARLKSYPPWPAIICDEDMLPAILLNTRPVTTKKADGTYNDAYADGGKKVHERTFPVMFLGTNEFAWIHNTDLSELKAEECKDVSEKGKNKSLLEAYKIAAEDHDLQHFKNLLIDHAKFLEEEEAAKAEKEAEKAQKGSKKKRKSEAKAQEDEVEADIDTAPKSAKKRKKAAETDDEEPEKPAKTPKTTKIKLTNKTPAASEKKAKEKPTKAKAEKRKSRAEAATEDEEMADAPEPEPEPPMDPEEARKGREREVLFLRHKLQKGFLSRDQAPQEDDMPQMSAFIKKLEHYEDLEAPIIRATKINKVLKALLKLNTIPRDEEFDFRKRSVELLGKWKILGAEPHEADGDKESKDTPTTNGVNGEAAAEDGQGKPAPDDEAAQAESSEPPATTDEGAAAETAAETATAETKPGVEEAAADEALESAPDVAETAEAVKTDA
ncbi:hypothetical protein DV735_g5752, partial [Chaetothyriales sp. CBS 134920]